MSLCRNRLRFDMKSEIQPRESLVSHTLNFSDSSDSELQNGEQLNTSDEAAQFSPIGRGFRTPEEGDASGFWDSGLCSPTPGEPSPQSRYRSNLSPNPMASPIPLHFEDSDGEENLDGTGHYDRIPPIPQTPYTPPHKKFRSLRLYDTPHTPKSLLQRANRKVTRVNRSKIGKRLLDPLGPQANVNPFTSSAQKTLTASGVKRSRAEMDSSLTEDSMDEDVDVDSPSNKKLALREINTSRYMEEFHEVCKLGDGEFGSVYKCINRLDGCTYAIKKSKTPVAGSANERSALNEVYAHAVLGKHRHVVRYYSAWAENDHMFIQNEFCNGGSLADVIAEQRTQQDKFSESELRRLMIHLAQGLKYIHSQGLVHLDIKPGNVFLQCTKTDGSPIRRLSESGRESGMEEDLDIPSDEEREEEEGITYKIGDLGHVTAMISPQVEEGDCRYLPAEILQDDYDHLPKADIFSLALTVYEAGSGAELPKNGPEWHAIRNGQLPDLPHMTPEFNALLKSMICKEPSQRPSAINLLSHSALCPLALKSRAQLRRELNAEKFKNEVLLKKLKEAQKVSPFNAVQPLKPGNSRLIGRKVNRSMSTQLF